VPKLSHGLGFWYWSRFLFDNDLHFDIIPSEILLALTCLNLNAAIKNIEDITLTLPSPEGVKKLG
jgi:hypothetical protein